MQVSNINLNYTTPISMQGNRTKKENKTTTQTKVVASGLCIAGAVALAVLISKGKFKKKPPAKPPVKPPENPSIKKEQSEVKKVVKKVKDKIEVKNLTEEEREKYIIELQAQTEDATVKAEIRRLIENGEWDNL